MRARKRASNSLESMTTPKMTKTIPWVKSATPWGTRKMTRGHVGIQRQEVNNTSRNNRRQKRRVLRLQPTLTQPIYPQCHTRTLTKVNNLYQRKSKKSFRLTCSTRRRTEGRKRMVQGNNTNRGKKMTVAPTARVGLGLLESPYPCI